MAEVEKISDQEKAIWLERPLTGLTMDQVAVHQEAGRTNDYFTSVSRSVRQIIQSNLLTLFNAILLVCMVVTLIFGSPKDVVFVVVLVVNAATGIVSEIKAKRTLDRMQILDTAPIKVVRDGKESVIPPFEIVPGDLLHLQLGDQVPADGIVAKVNGLRLNESILTGESVPQYRQPGEEILSGSAVVSGDGYIWVTKVGADSWANRMSAQVKQFRLAYSELQSGIDRILKVITWCLPVVIVLLMWAQVRYYGGLQTLLKEHLATSVVAVVAAIVGMIPQGLVLLTSINFASAGVKLARKGVLVQELPAVEILARVDTLCLDKTGTLTTGEIETQGFCQLSQPCASLIAANRLADEELMALHLLTADASNGTAQALDRVLASQAADRLGPSESWPEYTIIPFDSARKWSLLNLGSKAWVMGAPEIILAASPGKTEAISGLEQVSNFAKTGARVVALACSDRYQLPDLNGGEEPSLPEELTPVLIAVLAEELRDDAAQTLAFFRSQAVDVVIISGDNPVTVGALAQRAGLGRETGDASSGGNGELSLGFDARNLPTDQAEIQKILAEHRVFGRVTPDQKRALVHAFQAQGRTVAMTGDGVNDALALKDADLGIAMGNAASATKAAAKIVLLNSKFSTLPSVLQEGRRVLGNMERVSTLFLSKTVYAFLLAVAVGLLGMAYPYLPRHLTLVGSTTIGIPAFFLALAPSNRRYRPGFLYRVAMLVIPAGIMAGVASLAGYVCAQGDKAQATTVATLILAGLALILLGILSQPIFSWRGILLLAMAGLLGSAILVTPVREFFALSWPLFKNWLVIAGFIAAGAIGIIGVGVLWLRTYWTDEITNR